MHNFFEGYPFLTEKGPKDGNAKRDCTNNLRPYTCAGQDFSSASVISNDNISSTVTFNENSMKTDGISSAQEFSAKSESSCSNSYFIRPVCSPIDHYQEGSVDAKSSIPDKQVACNQESELTNRFDLNVSSSDVIRVMAKLGVPLSSHMPTQKFRGEFGWRGSGESSAFHLVSFPKGIDNNTPCVAKIDDHSSKDSRGDSTIIDLNLTPQEEDSSDEYGSGGSNSKQVKKFSIDLNTPLDGIGDDHIQWQRCQTTSGVETRPLERLDVQGSVYKGELRSQMQVFDQPFTMGQPALLRPVGLMDRLLIPVQPQYYSPYAMQVLPSHCYQTPPNASFFVTRDPYGGYSSSPQAFSGGGEVQNYLGTPPYRLGGEHGQHSHGDLSLVNGSWKESTDMRFSQQAARKRREPEGGWDALQFGFKHTSR
ncbi:unnamed protein product [Cuscuta epithymum]|uniref:Uncharacterized protein n=1 Tax=Cuscuta epithymum TaxID=186058 RepID=A0AAV0CX74_9ASTE|nr:unnamed protein product [Cuscuta epithymum]